MALVLFGIGVAILISLSSGSQIPLPKTMPPKIKIECDYTISKTLTFAKLSDVSCIRKASCGWYMPLAIPESLIGASGSVRLKTSDASVMKSFNIGLLDWSERQTISVCSNSTTAVLQLLDDKGNIRQEMEVNA